MIGPKVSITVSGDKLDKATQSVLREPGFSTWAELQVSTVLPLGMIRLMHDSASPIDCVHLTAGSARVLATVLNEMANDIENALPKLSFVEK